jgi:FMN-dependent NADH-azoreductase
MSHILNIESSPRSSKSASIAVANSFLAAYQRHQPDTTIDTLNVWTDHEAESLQKASEEAQALAVTF